MANPQDDLDLLLSLQDRVLETPPASPAGYLSDNGPPKRTGHADMSVFRDAVLDCLDSDTDESKKALKLDRPKLSKSNEVVVEKFSGVRIRNQLLSQLEIKNLFSDIRFVRLSAIKNVLIGDALSGCWATVGVLTEKGIPKMSTTGKNYCTWKICCLNAKSVSLFLFGVAYQKSVNEEVGSVFALFNCNTRKDNSEYGFSLSVFSANHIVKIGTSSDYGVCKAIKKDGLPCTQAVNKCKGTYCSYHTVNTSKKYITTRTELKGGNLRTGFKDYKLEGVHIVEPRDDRAKFSKSMRPVKFLSVDQMKKALSKADKVTTNTYSQGLRFLKEVAGKSQLDSRKNIHDLSKMQSLGKRPSSSSRTSTNSDFPVPSSQHSNTKRTKGDVITSLKSTQVVTEKMIELDFVSSDEEM
ncbi:protein MCM10 homolog [Impatiens glandulifera]|uniref:protein MCM10 homolog n=1 Tax=Impatiens glandulifera TaxID=253017 RepID=UPI001FB191CF|nr:protein MCM10 homolog [Impatiens glandulifera]